MLVVHDWLKEYVGNEIPSPEEIETLLTFHAFEIEGNEKVGNNDVIDVDVLPNRSSDCLCHRGIAREIATLTDTPLKKDPFAESPELPATTDKISVDIRDTQACRRFGAALLTGITVGESPEWLKERLVAIGQRPINNVVDATNYVMFSLGQPLHAYDGDLFPKEGGVWKFGVRMARDGEKVVTLSDELLELDSSIQLIVEGKGDTPVGIAGVKGGKTAEIHKGTTTVILEAANFDPTITRKAAQKLKLPTEASRRFENEVSREVVPYALKACAELIEHITSGTTEGYIDVYPTKHENPAVPVTLTKINSLLGLSLGEKEVEDIYRRLGFVYAKEGEGWTVTAPFERMDLQIAEDVIEEVGRVYGYEHIISAVPKTVPLKDINARHYYSEKIRGVLIELGFSEVITSSFRKKDTVRLQNALATDKQYLRSSLAHNITDVLDRNIPHVDLLGVDDARVFEIGTVFYKNEHGVEIDEHVAVAIGVRTKKTGATPKDDEILRGVLKKIEATLNIVVNYDIEKGVAEFNLSALLRELPRPKAYEPIAVAEELQYTPFSTYPFISRDIALWVPEGKTVSEVETVLNKAAGELRVRTRLFDTFAKDGKVSYAFRLVFQSKEKTLTDDAVNECMDAVYAAVETNDWTVR